MSDATPEPVPMYHAVWRGYRSGLGRWTFEKAAALADHRSFEVIEQRLTMSDREHSRYFVRHTDCPVCRNTRWREVPERPESLDHVHPYDMNGWAGTNLVTPEQWRRTAELIVQAEQGGPDVFAYEWPPPRRRGSYRVLRGDEPAGGFAGTDLREAIGYAVLRDADGIIDRSDPECPPWTRGDRCPECGAVRWVHGAAGE